MKKILLMALMAFSSSCMAQKKIALLNDNSIVKLNSENFIINKEKGMVTIEKTSNKLSKIKQSSPNLPLNFNLYPSVKIDFPKLTQICAENISINELEKLSQIKQASLFIRIRSNIYGKPLEVLFFTDANSSLNIEQLDKIEKAIFKEKIISVKPEISKYLAGSNFLVNDAMIYFEDMLKVKN